MNNSIAIKNSPSPLHEKVQRLLHLKSVSVKDALSNVGEEAAITYLSELFKGNGWTVAFHMGERNHRSLLLSDPKQPDTIILIVKFIVTDEELSYDAVRGELTDFENNIGPIYGCTQFCLLAANGFEAKTERLENFNMLLQDWSSVEELMNHYSKDKVQEPRIQLFAHNKQTYKKVRAMMAHAKGVAVVQATGTGKSYLIARLLQDFAGKKRLVMAPSYYIIDQIKEHIRWETDLPGDANKIEFMTYARSMNLTTAEITDLKPEMIVLDEFHRCGAEEWGRGVQNILNAYPQKFKFGTSATPIRYLDNGRDMSMELFQGHVAENLSLAQAIARNILPMPKYVCALYTLSEEINTMRSKIATSRKNEETKKRLLLEMDAFHIDWERSRGIPHVLKKHLRKNMRKFIVFCKDEAHLNEMEPIVKKWFKEAMDDIPVKSYKVHSKEMQSDEQLDAFKNDTSKDHLHLLFSIDMLNEGLHVNEVNGVVLLRPTESPNIFYQQIGRCLKVGLNERPVIFDFVNNFKAIRTHDFIYDLDLARMELLNRRSEEGLEDRCPRFNVNDEVREITEVFGEIEFKLDNWNEMYERLEAYHKRFRHANVPDEWVEDPSLARWLRLQRKRQHFGKLETEPYEKLIALGVKFNYKPMGAPVEWQQRFDELCDYKKENGHTEVMPDDNKRLNIWILRQRTKYRKGLLISERIKKLESIGFAWELENSKIFEKRFLAMQKFKEEFGHLNFSIKHPLTSWQTHLRTQHKEGKLTEQQMQRLTDLGFDYVFRENQSMVREKRIKALESFYKKYGHVDVTNEYTDFPSLAEWIVGIRKQRRKGVLNKEIIDRLDAVGMNWESDYLDRRWDKMYNELLNYYKRTGTSFIKKDEKVNRELKTWCTSQRSCREEGKMQKERLDKLNKIGFAWDHKDATWESNFRELCAFKESFGDCLPTPGKGYKKLFTWCQNIRKTYREGKLSEARKKALSSIGFVYAVYESAWDARFNELLEFKKRYGHSRVTGSYNKEYKELIEWRYSNMDLYKKGKLSAEKMQRLRIIGLMDPDLLPENIWEKRFNELLKYKKRYGSCKVSWTHKNENKDYEKLFNWCSNTRKVYTSGKLSPERKKRLDKIGFM